MVDLPAPLSPVNQMTGAGLLFTFLHFEISAQSNPKNLGNSRRPIMKQAHSKWGRLNVVDRVKATPVAGVWYPLPQDAPDAAGYVDGVFDDEIRGWVFDAAQPKRLLTVCIRINGEFAGKVTTCLYRDDLVSLFQAGGLNGFAFRIPARFFSHASWSVEALLEDGRHLPPTPMTVERVAPDGHGAPKPVRTPCLLFIHMPKTAGTTLRSLLGQQSGFSRYLLLYPDVPGFPGEYLFYLTESQLANLECIYGHFGFRLHQYLPQACEYATVLREPVARTISHFFHLQRAAQPDLESVASGEVEEFFLQATNSDFDNVMTRLISGETAEVLPFGGVTESVFERAIDNLHQRFVYAGLQEEMDQVQCELAGRLGLVPQRLERENAGNPRQQESLTTRTLNAIRERNDYDVRLYEYVREHFWASHRNGWIRPRSGSASR